MRLNIIKSPNATSYYVIKDYKKNGKRSTKVVEKLGTLAELLEKCGDSDPVAWANAYIEELNRREKENEFEYVAQYSSSKMLVKDRQRLFKGGCLFVQSLYSQLGLPKICQQIAKDYKITYSLSDILNMLLATRILDPASKRSSLISAQDYLEKPVFSLHQVYRALEIFAQNSDFLQAELYRNSKKLAKRNDKILYYDCTNYYFEIEADEGLKQYGKSKEHRPNPIVQMGLFMDADGLPLAFRLFNGNENEQPSLKPLEETILKDFNLSKFVVCTDAGLASHENRLFNNEGERAYIVTQSLKTLKQHLRDWALDPTGWQVKHSTELYDISQIDPADEAELDRIYYKSRWIKEKGLEQQLIVTFSLKHKLYQQDLRAKQVERAQGKIANPASLDRRNVNDPARFVKRYSVTEDGELAGQDVYYLDPNTIAKEAQYDGFYGICTNLDDNPLDILAVNRGRWEIEAAFRIMKSELKARPVYLKRDDRIQAHFLTCFIALLIYRIMTKRIQAQLPENSPSGEIIVKTLSQMDFLEKEGDGFIPTYTRTDITDALHDAFGFRTDLELVLNREMRKIVNLTKTQK
jgi:transposase